MGKPIAGQNQYPFKTMGLLVDSAKIDGVTYTKTLYVYKQSSSFLFDLIEGSTGRIFKDIRLTWKDNTGRNLKYYEPVLMIADKLPERTFARKVQSTRQNIYGYLVMIHSNKIKVSTGEYIFYEDDYDLDLVGVTLSPQSIIVKKGDKATFNVSFIPPNYQNVSGIWTSMDDSIATVSTQGDHTVSFDTHKVGETAVYFTPDANTSVVAGGYIYVIPEDETPDLSYLTTFGSIISDYPNSYIPTTPIMVPGGEMLVHVFPYPNDFVPTEPYEITYDETAIESVTKIDDNTYKVKATMFGDNYTQYYINFQYSVGEMYANSFVTFFIFTPDYDEYKLHGMPTASRVGQTVYANLAASPNSLKWTSSDESIAEMVGPGIIKGISEGNTTFKVQLPSGKFLEYPFVVSNKCADYVTYNAEAASIGEYSGAEPVQYEIVVHPPECAQYYKPNWQKAFTDPALANVFNISSSGLLTFNTTGHDFKNRAASVPIRPFNYENNNPLTTSGIDLSRSYTTRKMGDNQDDSILSFGFNRPQQYVYIGGTKKMHFDVYGRFKSGVKYEIKYEFLSGEDCIILQQEKGWEARDQISNYYLEITGVKKGVAEVKFWCDEMPNTEPVIITYTVF